MKNRINFLEKLAKNFEPDYKFENPPSKNYHAISIQANYMLAKIENKNDNYTKAKFHFDTALYQFEQMKKDEKSSKEKLEFYHEKIFETAKEINLPIEEQIIVAFLGQNLKPKFIEDFLI